MEDCKLSDVLVVFGSSSDSAVYSKIMQGLKDKGISAEMRICSAHRTPKKIDEIVEKSSARLFVAGAGLSAALPGAIASKTVKPVIGVPVSGNYAGLDALLSVAQMPSGFPVITVGVDCAENAVSLVQLALQEHHLVKVIGNKYSKTVKERIDKAGAIAGELGLHFEFIESIEGNKFDPNQEVLVNVVELSRFSPIRMANALVLNVPILRESGTPEALEFFEKSQTGVWLGLNRVDNAMIAAAQLLNIHSGKFDEKIAAFRNSLHEKACKADAEEKEKFR